MHGSTTARERLRGEEHFRALVEEHRATLHAHCYALGA